MIGLGNNTIIEGNHAFCDVLGWEQNFEAGDEFFEDDLNGLCESHCDDANGCVYIENIAFDYSRNFSSSGIINVNQAKLWLNKCKLISKVIVNE